MDLRKAVKGGKSPEPGREGAESEFIRQFKARPLVYAGTILVLIIVIVAFVFVPVFVPEAGGGAGDRTFGYWNKTPITYVPGNYFAQRQRAAAEQIQYQITGDNFGEMSYQVWRQAFTDTVIHTAILDEMRLAGYEAPPEMVNKQVAQLPELQEDGVFSPARWNRLDASTQQNVWRDIRESIAIRRYIEDVTGLRISSAEADFVAGLGERQRSFSLAVFPLSSWPAGELAAYAEENAGLFITTHLSRITVTSNEREAAQVLKSITDGTVPFEDAARLHSQDSYADRGGDMGLKMACEIAEELENPADREALAALAAGEYSAILKTPGGWAFFRAEAEPYPADPGDAATAEKIRAYVMQYERGRVEDWVIGETEFFAESVRDNGLEQAAFFRGLELRSFGPLPLNYGALSYSNWGYPTDGVDLFPTLSSFSVAELYAAGGEEIFWRAAFSTPLNEASSPFVLGDNVLLLFPTSENEAGEEALASIREIYTSYWVSSTTEQGLNSLFLSSPKLKDRFQTVYRQISGGS
ncbi:MAG: SurA N-terminal domain-containing protein [Spirochaetaceae bacterium]|jgi:hypothetical protein|nr:SurA N-terminal domain-containing protein [Spirochaetaceae bacterium]